MYTFITTDRNKPPLKQLGFSFKASTILFYCIDEPLESHFLETLWEHLHQTKEVVYFCWGMSKFRMCHQVTICDKCLVTLATLEKLFSFVDSVMFCWFIILRGKLITLVRSLSCMGFLMSFQVVWPEEWLVTLFTLKKLYPCVGSHMFFKVTALW